jgi:hypothetical protein
MSVTSLALDHLLDNHWGGDSLAGVRLVTSRPFTFARFYARFIAD